MLTTNDLSDLNEYLEEKHKRNREYDIRNMSKITKHFDPLLDQEPDPDLISLDPDQPVLAEDSRSCI